MTGKTCTIFPGGYEYAPDYDQGYAGDLVAVVIVMPESLLAVDEPAPVTVHNANGRSLFLIVADHAGNSMPRALRPLEAVGPQNQSYLLSRKCCLLLAQKTEVQNRPA